MRNVMKKMVLPMAALPLLEDLANGAIRRERVFRKREDLLANDDNWLISRFRMCDKHESDAYNIFLRFTSTFRSDHFFFPCVCALLGPHGMYRLTHTLPLISFLFILIPADRGPERISLRGSTSSPQSPTRTL
ncbi:hypothetical protein N1851_017144 [Merluccius polli]|uniref:Uncharacterized protein n=1 Tax=Merluccius polli TaxID=89951 RepID=A0AA47P1I7_MERPO|nr:hypothetical protein N1851_017144 [Merluccius polli]